MMIEYDRLLIPSALLFLFVHRYLDAFSSIDLCFHCYHGIPVKKYMMMMKDEREVD